MTLTPPRFHIADDMPMSLGKAIARAIAPKVDHITAFEMGDHTKTFFRDNVTIQWPVLGKKNNGAAKKARTVEDVLSDPTEDEMQYIIKMRGGCRCSWPNAAPPCSICTTEYSEEEAAEALAECSEPEAAPPSVQKFNPGDKVQLIERYPTLRRMHGVCTVTRIEGKRLFFVSGKNFPDEDSYNTEDFEHVIQEPKAEDGRVWKNVCGFYLRLADNPNGSESSMDMKNWHMTATTWSEDELSNTEFFTLVKP